MTEEEKEAREILNNTEWEGFMITIKNLIQNQDTEINKLNNVIDRIIECVLLHKPFSTFVCQSVSVNDCNKYKNKGGCNNCIKEYFMKQEEN